MALYKFRIIIIIINLSIPTAAEIATNQPTSG